MSEFYVWTEAELGLNVADMDKEHQQLIDRMNALYRGAQNKLPANELQGLIDDLAQFTVKHFSDEEAYMESVNFPGLATHKIIHQQLLTQFQGYVDEFKKTKNISPSFFNFLKVWLTSHIRGIDMKYSVFLKKKPA